MAIRTLSSREVYRNHWLSVREDAIERPNGTHGIYGVVDKHDCAAILPIDGDHIWLVEQYRYPIGERALELPQGSAVMRPATRPVSSRSSPRASSSGLSISDSQPP